MDIPQALDEIRKAIDEIVHLSKLHYNNLEFKQWCLRVANILELGFGAESTELKRFIKNVQSKGRKGTVAELQRWYIERLQNAYVVLNSIIEKYELVGVEPMRDDAGERIRAELEQFLHDLERFRRLQIKRRNLGDSPTLKKLRAELVRRSATLRQVIAPPEGKLLMEQMGRVFDAFDEAFRKSIYTLGLAPQWYASIEVLIQKTNEAIGRLEQVPVLGLPVEALYPSGAPYDAYKDIRKIVGAASKKLIIVDPYVDGTLFDLLQNVKPKVQVQVLTRNMQGDFQLAGQKLKEQREKAGQGTLEIRKSGKFHDRFIFADGKVFHIGASIKDAGTRACFMSEVEGADIKTTLKKAMSGYWDEAEIVL